MFSIGIHESQMSYRISILHFKSQQVVFNKIFPIYVQSTKAIDILSFLDLTIQDAMRQAFIQDKQNIIQVSIISSNILAASYAYIKDFGDRANFFRENDYQTVIFFKDVRHVIEQYIPMHYDTFCYLEADEGIYSRLFIDGKLIKAFGGIGILNQFGSQWHAVYQLVNQLLIEQQNLNFEHESELTSFFQTVKLPCNIYEDFNQDVASKISELFEFRNRKHVCSFYKTMVQLYKISTPCQTAIDLQFKCLAKLLSQVVTHFSTHVQSNKKLILGLTGDVFRYTEAGAPLEQLFLTTLSEELTQGQLQYIIIQRISQFAAPQIAACKNLFMKHESLLIFE